MGAGRKPKFSTADELRKQVERYMADCEAEDVFPDLAGMRLYLGISERTMQRYSEEEGFREVFEYAKDCRESYLVRRMTKDNKLAQGCLNALKQPSNGGYIDRPLESGDRKLVIEFKHNLAEGDFK